eukprot:gene9537-10541_t
MEEDIQLKLENIRNIIHAFKNEQESIILRSDFGKITTGNRLSSQHSPNVAKKIIRPVSNHDDLSDVELIEQILNQDIVIMPVSASTVSNKRLWPQALAAKYSTNTATIGNIESHGTLWRLLPHSDGYPGNRVFVQASEIGLEPRFLSANLKLVEQKEEAALWNVRRCILPKSSADLAVLEEHTTKGIHISLELVDNSFIHQLPTLHSLSLSYRPTNALDIANYPKVYPNGPGPSLLTCAFGQLSEELNILLLSKEDMVNQKQEQMKHFYIIWEVCPESWINEDLDFLDRYLT